MVAYCALVFLAAAASEPPATQGSLQAPPETAARATARATVRILSGAEVRLGLSANSGNYVVSEAHVRDETGIRRPAQLVEFQ